MQRRAGSTGGRPTKAAAGSASARARSYAAGGARAGSAGARRVSSSVRGRASPASAKWTPARPASARAPGGARAPSTARVSGGARASRLVTVPPISGAASRPGRERSPAGAKIGLSRSGLIIVALASLGLVAVASFIVVTDVPLNGIISQHRQLAQATAELSSSIKQVSQLQAAIHALQTPADIELLAHSDFNLVQPGQRSFLVVPPPGESLLDQPLPKRLPAQVGPLTGSADATALGGTAGPSSPAGSSGGTVFPPLAGASAPSGSLTPGARSGVATTAVVKYQPGTGAGAPAHSRWRSGRPGFWSRVLRDLEFWRS